MDANVEVLKESVIWKPRIKTSLFSETALSFVSPVLHLVHSREIVNIN
jgi:hypothetical protein